MYNFKIHFLVPQQESERHVSCKADVQVNEKDVYMVYNIVPDLKKTAITTPIELKVVDDNDLNIEWLELTKTGIPSSLVWTIGEAIVSSLLWGRRTKQKSEYAIENMSGNNSMNISEL
jgi:hypothetical protein